MLIKHRYQMRLTAVKYWLTHHVKSWSYFILKSWTGSQNTVLKEQRDFYSAPFYKLSRWFIFNKRFVHMIMSPMWLLCYWLFYLTKPLQPQVHELALSRCLNLITWLRSVGSVAMEMDVGHESWAVVADRHQINISFICQYNLCDVRNLIVVVWCVRRISEMLALRSSLQKKK